MRRACITAAVFFLTSIAAAPDALGRGQGRIRITWFGQATFEIVSPAGKRLLIDPFLKRNPSTPSAFKNLALWKPDAILVTHSHFDHTEDVLEIAQNSGAPVIGNYEWVETLSLPEKQRWGGNVGGSFTVGDATVYLVPAMHSSQPGGRPVGYVIRFAGGPTIYDTGDTWIFGDMSLIQEIYHPEIILIDSGGGRYSESPEAAALAVRKYFKPSVVIPMHFGAFPGSSKEAQVRQAFAGDGRVRFMVPGTTEEFQ